ncbi:MAG: hypothetical protein ACK47R_09305, partial [Planctomycetia bacterium]
YNSKWLCPVEAFHNGANGLKVVDNIACTVCGCVCDDLKLVVDGNRVTQAQGACKLAEPWFLDMGNCQPPAAQIDGRKVDYQEAISRAAELLDAAHAPLVYGLSRSSTDGQRAAIALAEKLGATIDTTASLCHAPSISALQ